jgi:hypothetical protein
MAEDRVKLEAEHLAFAENIVEALTVLDALEGSAAAAQPVPISELYAYATDPERQARPELLDALAANPRLRDDLGRLLSNAAVVHLPQVAAASTGEIKEREGDGCRIEFRASRADSGQVYVIISLEKQAPREPSTLIICDTKGQCVKVALPTARDGRVQLLLDTDSDIAKGLRNISTQVYLS